MTNTYKASNKKASTSHKTSWIKHILHSELEFIITEWEFDLFHPKTIPSSPIPSSTQYLKRRHNILNATDTAQPQLRTPTPNTTTTTNQATLLPPITNYNNNNNTTPQFLQQNSPHIVSSKKQKAHQQYGMVQSTKPNPSIHTFSSIAEI